MPRDLLSMLECSPVLKKRLIPLGSGMNGSRWSRGNAASFARRFLMVQKIVTPHWIVGIAGVVTLPIMEQ